MLLKKKQSKTSSLRHQLLSDKTLLYTKKIPKILIKRLPKNSGRNNNGHICIRHRGGGFRKLYRTINWNNLLNEGVVVGIEYDPLRSSLLARVFNSETKNFSYILANKFLFPGSKISMGPNLTEIRIGNRLPLLKIPAGSIISAVGSKRALFARAAGTSCQLLQKGPIISKIRVPSGEIKFLNSNTFASIGSISNEMHNLQIIGKAGKSRLKGLRPKVRGVAMNPIDHPHGGAGGRPSVTPWGKPTKGKPTKQNKKKYVKI